MAEWRFVTNHALGLRAIDRDSSARLRDIADEVGLTERAVQSIVNDLVEAGFITISKVSQRNEYEVHTDVSAPEIVSVEGLLELLP